MYVHIVRLFLLVLTIPELSFIDGCAENGNKGRVNLVLLTKRDVYKASMSENCLAVCAAILSPSNYEATKKPLEKVAFLFDFKAKIWWPLLGLNQRPSDYESPALTTELRGRGEGL